MEKIFIEKSGDYTLFKLPTNNCTPYCVAWLYDCVSDCWSQGHYFSSLDSAVSFLKLVNKLD